MKREFFSYTPVKEDILSAAEFLRLSSENPLDIERSRFVPPVIGKRGFGRFHVVYRTPILKQREPA